MNYAYGASSDCRQLTCCHARSDGSIPSDVPDQYKAGPFGHKDCDMPFEGLKEILGAIRDSLETAPNLIFVTGGVVSDQTG